MDLGAAPVLTERTRRTWEPWLAVTRQRCHLHYDLVGGDLGSHLTACFRSGAETAQRVRSDIGAHKTERILEVGCSVGFNCFGLARVFPDALTVGIEPDAEALVVARATAEENGIANVAFTCGTGERLPYPDGAFDLVVCHTVIEHVRDVEQTLAEIGRVLAPGGVLHLEAPNYIWPREPHVDVWCIPLLGKGLMKVCGRLQGKAAVLGYVDHLQLVHPRRLERAFAANHLAWHNRAADKLNRALGGEPHTVKAYHRAGRLLNLAGRMGIGRLIAAGLLRTGLYPSVLYTVRKPC